MLVKDLVWLDEEGKFRNDVQLSHFEDKKINQSLIGCYIFSYDAPGGYLSSAKLLESIIHSYLNPQAHKNRTVVIGQYGHGKSHLALVMANYFGKPIDSVEYKTVISRLERAIDNPVLLEKFKEFRKNRPEYLVLRLRGDNPRSLRKQFVQAIEKGLKEHAATKDVELPFWQRTAQNFLTSLKGETLERANAFLEQHGTEVILLTQELENYSDRTYQLVVDLFTHLHGVAPDLGGETSMKEVLNWVGETYCGTNKPLGGMIILFDEFSLFIQNQSKRGVSGELQDLLNGVQDQAGKAVFVAFSQHDPSMIARSVLQGIGLENLEHELNRIESQLILYSLMESVIDAYLTQSDNYWAELRSDPNVRGPLAKASNLCMEVFSKRYEGTLRWTPETFDEIVLKGCFPLHPITTAVLCDIQLQAVQKAGNPRTVLGFVERMVRERADEQALKENGRLNWVHAIELIDYFYDYLPKDPKILYEIAKRNLTKESPEEHDKLLKALLLEEIIQIRRDSQIQVEFLAEAAGLELKAALDNLKQLAKANIIRYDPVRRLNTFMPAMSDPNRMSALLKEKRSEFVWDWDRLQKLNKLDDFKPLDVDIKWGNPNDWAATQYVITSEFFDEKHLTKIVKKFVIATDGFKEGERGAVIWLVARTAEEVSELRINANKILDTVFCEEHPLPVLAMVPDKPNLELLDAYETFTVLQEFSNEERQEVGQAVYQMQIAQNKEDLIEGINILRGDLKHFKTELRTPRSFSTPKLYRAALQARDNLSLAAALSLTYELAYRGAPLEFFTQYKVTQLALRNAVKTVAAVLIKNKLSTSRDMLQTQNVAQDLCDKFLVKSWRILANDYSIQKPTQNRISQTWNYLDRAIAVGSKDIQLRSLLESLINPPFGYDYNTATLLISAWLGFNSLEVKYTINGRLNSVDDVAVILTNSRGVKEFLEAVTTRSILCISRINLGEVINEVKKKIEHAHRDSFSQDEAKKLIHDLEAHSKNKSIPEEVSDQALNAAEHLRQALEKAEEYDSQANKILEAIARKKMDSLLDVPKLMEKLPEPGNVAISSSTAEKLRDLWRQQLTAAVEQCCQEHETARDLIEVGRNRDVLKKGKKDIQRGAPDLEERFELALESLSKDEQRLRARNQEAPIRAEIETMKTSVPYIELLEFQSRLENITGLSEETMKLRNDKLSQIKMAISQLERYATGLIRGVAELHTQKEIDDWNAQYLKSQKLLEDSLFQKELEAKSETVTQLRNLILEMEEIKSLKLNDPNDVENTFKKLDSLENKYARWLNEKTKKTIDQIRSDVEKTKNNRVTAAMKWVESVIRCSNERDFQEVLQLSGSIPPFTSDTEKEKIHKLVAEAEREIEKDLVTKIEREFEKIKDIDLQLECLERLQAILQKERSSTR